MCFIIIWFTACVEFSSTQIGLVKVKFSLCLRTTKFKRIGSKDKAEHTHTRARAHF